MCMYLLHLHRGGCQKPTLTWGPWTVIECRRKFLDRHVEYNTECQTDPPPPAPTHTSCEIVLLQFSVYVCLSVCASLLLSVTYAVVKSYFYNFLCMSVCLSVHPSVCVSLSLSLHYSVTVCVTLCLTPSLSVSLCLYRNNMKRNAGHLH